MRPRVIDGCSRPVNGFRIVPLLPRTHPLHLAPAWERHSPSTSVSATARSRKDRILDNLDNAAPPSMQQPAAGGMEQPWKQHPAGLSGRMVWDNGPQQQGEANGSSVGSSASMAEAHVSANDDAASEPQLQQRPPAPATEYLREGVDAQAPSTSYSMRGEQQQGAAAAPAAAPTAGRGAAGPEAAAMDGTGTSAWSTWDETAGTSGDEWYDSGWGRQEPIYDWGEAQAGGLPGEEGSGNGTSSSGRGEAEGGARGGRRAWATQSGGGGGTFGAGGQYRGGTSGAQEREVFADAEPSGMGAGAGAGAQRYDGVGVVPSDITTLSRKDMEAVLPLVPNGRQSDFYQPRSLQERIVQLLGSLGTSMMLSKVVVLAGPALLYPVWSPWIRAGLRNLELYAKQFRFVGLWRAQVMQVEVSGWQFPGTSGAMVRLLVGDGWPGGARVQLEFPYQPRAELLRVGEPAELLVLCKDEAFVTFKVVRELYLPESGLWLAEYPFVDRSAFLDISLSIEQARQAVGAD